MKNQVEECYLIHVIDTQMGEIIFSNTCDVGSFAKNVEQLKNLYATASTTSVSIIWQRMRGILKVERE